MLHLVRCGHALKLPRMHDAGLSDRVDVCERALTHVGDDVAIAVTVPLAARTGRKARFVEALEDAEPAREEPRLVPLKERAPHVPVAMPAVAALDGAT